MSSDEVSINKETKPSVQTVVGTSRHVTEGVLASSGFMDETYRAVARRSCAKSNVDTAGATPLAVGQRKCAAEVMSPKLCFGVLFKQRPPKGGPGSPRNPLSYAHISCRTVGGLIPWIAY